MDDLTLLREFRAEAPASAPADLWSRALRAAEAPARVDEGARARRGRRLVAVGAVATAATLAGALLVAPGSTPSSAAAVLDRAAIALADAPAPPAPGPHQWLYQRTVRLDAATGKPGTHFGYAWLRMDGQLWADRMPDGHVLVQGLEYWPLGRPEQWYDVVTQLPEQPADVIEYLRDDPLFESDGASQADRDFDEVTTALTAETVIPPASRARLYLALATIPGVGVDENAAPDLAGRPVLSITYTGDLSLGRAGDRWELLLDPSSYDVLGLRGTAGSDIDLGGGTVIHPGTVWTEFAFLDHRLVDAAGDTA
jgi:hypothetical protein